MKHAIPSDHAIPPALRDLFEAKLATGDIELPLLPDTAARVLAASDEEETDAREIAELIQRDQSLAAHVMRVANSAAYGGLEQIVSLQQAVSRLGMSAVAEIALAVSMRGRVFRVPGYQSHIRTMWQHSAMAGVYAKEVARTRRFNVEGAFLCGLMHDVGRPVVMMAFLDVLKAVTDKPAPFRLLEAAMEHYHELVGGQLAEQWDLPPWVRSSIQYHHDYTAAVSHHEDVRSTYLADLLAKWALEDGTTPDDFDFNLPVLADLGLYRDDVEELLGRRGEVLDIAESFL
ncbi:MAG: HDOD domain-containing protein [Planctomycetota bacterium]